MTRSITGINTKLTIMADTIQQARKKLSSDNFALNLSKRETRRIILLCLIFTLAKDNTSNELSLTDVLAYLKLNNCDALDNLTIQKSNEINLVDTIRLLSRFKHDPEWNALVVYAVESLEYDTEEYFASEKKRGVRINKKKKDTGIYYTPQDVVTYMTSSCIVPTLERVQYPTVLDCSCGSGVFLLQCLKELDNKYNIEKKLTLSLKLLEKCIWGIDVSENAIDACLLTLAKYYIETYKDSKDSFDIVWNTIKKSFIIGDSTKLGQLLDMTIGFPKRFDCIIGNPPYVSQGRKSNCFIDFVYNLINYSSCKGCSSLIVPLSICYSSNEDFVELRRIIQKSKGKWMFINFDRSPDSLFGDQVKTRNTILICDTESEDNCILTTGLKRWTSENRIKLFKNISFCNVSGVDISRGIPKLTSIDEKQLYYAIESKNDNLYRNFSKSKNNEDIIVLNGTAYNWLCVYDHIPPSIDEFGNRYISNSSKIYHVSEKNSKYFIIALLSNRIAYWYWIALGDGFHVNSSFIRNCFIGKKSFTNEQYKELCRLGFEYSERVKQYPTQSCNAGKTLVNYSYQEAFDIVEQIECIILSALDLPKNIGETIEKWYDNQISCDRKE